MIKGVFGRVERNHAVGWAYDTDSDQAVLIKVKQGKKVIATGIADLYRPDLSKIVPNMGGKVGYKIQLPKGRKRWENISVLAKGEKLKTTPLLSQKIERTTSTLRLKVAEMHYFIHIPKTAGTAFKVLLESYFQPEDFFPSRKTVAENRGLYPRFDEIIKYDAPEKMPKVLLGHYPFALHQVVTGTVYKTVILREPVQRVISNIFHLKNNDPRLKGMSPEQIYKKGKWQFRNFQVRHLVDKSISLNMRYIDAKPLLEADLHKAIRNMRNCELVGISDHLAKTVELANAMYGWKLQAPSLVNVAKTSKEVSTELLQLIQKDNVLDQKLFKQAVKRFDKLCTTHIPEADT